MKFALICLVVLMLRAVSVTGQCSPTDPNAENPFPFRTAYISLSCNNSSSIVNTELITQNYIGFAIKAVFLLNCSDGINHMVSPEQTLSVRDFDEQLQGTFDVAELELGPEVECSVVGCYRETATFSGNRQIFVLANNPSSSCVAGNPSPSITSTNSTSTMISPEQETSSDSHSSTIITTVVSSSQTIIASQIVQSVASSRTTQATRAEAPSLKLVISQTQSVSEPQPTPEPTGPLMVQNVIIGQALMSSMPLGSCLIVVVLIVLIATAVCVRRRSLRKRILQSKRTGHGLYNYNKEAYKDFPGTMGLSTVVPSCSLSAMSDIEKFTFLPHSTSTQNFQPVPLQIVAIEQWLQAPQLSDDGSLSIENATAVSEPHEDEPNQDTDQTNISDSGEISQSPQSADEKDITTSITPGASDVQNALQRGYVECPSEVEGSVALPSISKGDIQEEIPPSSGIEYSLQATSQGGPGREECGQVIENSSAEHESTYVPCVQVQGNSTQGEGHSLTIVTNYIPSLSRNEALSDEHIAAPVSHREDYVPALPYKSNESMTPSYFQTQDQLPEHIGREDESPVYLNIPRNGYLQMLEHS